MDKWPANKARTRAAGKVWTSGRQSDKMGLVPESGRQKIFEKVRIGVDKSGRQGYDGTISQSGREQEMITNLATARRTAEAAFRANPTNANLKAFQAAGKAEMDAYLVDFDARHAATETAEQEAEEAPSSPALVTKVAEDIEKGDVILTKHGWVVVTFWEHFFARLINPNTEWNQRVVTDVWINRRYKLEAGAQITVHANPEGFTHERFQASRRLLDGFKTWA